MPTSPRTPPERGPSEERADDGETALACGGLYGLLPGSCRGLRHSGPVVEVGSAIGARRLDNPYLDRFLAHFRRKTGLTLLDKSADYRRMLEVMSGGDGLGMVADQDAGPRGLFVNFFGRPASTHKSIALLALEYRAP